MRLYADWHRTETGGEWRVLNEARHVIGLFDRLDVEPPCRLELESENHGWLSVDGHLEANGRTARIRAGNDERTAGNDRLTDCGEVAASAADQTVGGSQPGIDSCPVGTTAGDL